MKAVYRAELVSVSLQKKADKRVRAIQRGLERTNRFQNSVHKAVANNDLGFQKSLLEDLGVKDTGGVDVLKLNRGSTWPE